MNLTDPIYSDPDLARQHLERLHWPEGPICPHCGCMGHVTKLAGKSTRPGVYKCNDCEKPFTVTVGTIMEDSKIPLNKWLMAYALLSGSKKGFSAHQLHRSLGITYKSALVPRASYPRDNGQRQRAARRPRRGCRGGSFRSAAPKKAVVTLVERDGRARSFHVASVNAKTLRSVLVQNVDRASTLATDDFSLYGPVGREFKWHGTVNHSAREYASTRTVHGYWTELTERWHSNTAENFFSIFKRGVIGTYHHLSEAHMHRYSPRI